MKKYYWKAWNNEPINGIEAKRIRKYLEMDENDEAYLILDENDNIIYFQHLAPFVEGKIKITKENMKKYAEEQIKYLNGEFKEE